MPLQIGKIPIVVPRQVEFNEHVNNHQVEFAKAVEKRMKNIITIDDIDKLKMVIINYDVIKTKYKGLTSSNNSKFCTEFEDIIEKCLN